MTDLSTITFPSMKKADAKVQLSALQLSLMKYQQRLVQTGKRAVVVLEGTDAAGKGGVIARIVKKMDPRGVRVYPIGPPSPKEASQHYLQRFWEHMPSAGQLVIFDRSWYGRVLVERVEGSLPERVWKRAYQEICQFEQMLIHDDILLIKIFLHIGRDEQKRRFITRFRRSDKRWKLTAADLRSRQYWSEYQTAYQHMFDKTSLTASPWNLIPANCKQFARVQTLEAIQASFQSYISLDQVVLMPPEVERQARKVLGL